MQEPYASAKDVAQLLQLGACHLIGIGGIGVSGVARLLHARGLVVQGSDVRESQLTLALRGEGIPVFIGHDARHIEGVGCVITSTAIPTSNPELAAARRLGIPVVHRSQALGWLLAQHRGIGIIGTHGKGTVSSAVTWLLDQAGWQPGFVIGGLLQNYGINARPAGVNPAGQSWLVAEVDESDGSLVNSKPEVAILNNLELDHLNYYPSWTKLQDTILQFFHDNERLELVVINADDPGCQRILAALQPGRFRVVTFGFSTETADFRGLNLQGKRMAGSFDLAQRADFLTEKLGRVDIALPGAYNASNLLGALATVLSLGVPFATAAAAAPGFLGLENRFTLVDAAGVEVVKDYISHPTGIQRVLEAARAQADGPVIAVFKPYRFTMIHYLMDDYQKAFAEADRVLVTELYTAGEVPIAGTDVHVLCDRIRQVVPDVSYVHDLADIPAWLQSEVHAPSTVLFFGGDDLFRTADQYVALRLRAADLVGS
jgi:UDP-N-acetylmuramate--alanine ligase